MKLGNSFTVTFMLLFSMAALSGAAAVNQVFCGKYTKCYKKVIKCPAECPVMKPADPKVKACYIDCNSPKCESMCRGRKPNCNAPGAACYDPRFIGGDSRVFYFHGKSNEHFSLISDLNLQVNARFIGLRPAGRTRDYTWIQAIGIVFDSHNFTLEAKKVATWEENVDQLQLSYDGKAVILPENHLSDWSSPKSNLTVERTAKTNSVTITLSDIAEISVKVVPITEKDNRVHNYQIPADDCFAHLELQFKFFGLSPWVEGVLGRTYQPDFQNPAKSGVAMPVVGGEDKYMTSSLLSSDCNLCVFSPAGRLATESTVMESATFDCTSKIGSGSGIVCRK